MLGLLGFRPSVAGDALSYHFHVGVSLVALKHDWMLIPSPSSPITRRKYAWSSCLSTVDDRQQRASITNSNSIIVDSSVSPLGNKYSLRAYHGYAAH